MNNLLCAASQLLTPPQSPVGQVHFDTPGTYQWICPEGVTEVSVALLGAGGSGKHITANGRYRMTGYSGGITYLNKVPVIPGNIYSILVAASNAVPPYSEASYRGAYSVPSIAFGHSSADGQYPSVGGSPTGNLGRGVSGVSTPAPLNGYGFDLRTWKQLTTPARVAGDYSAVGPGAGGGLGPTRDIATRGGPGAVRIIWGENRAFPNLNIGDM